MTDEELMEKNLSILASTRRHMDHPKRYKDLYYVPDFEKAVITVALDLFEEAYKSDVKKVNGLMAKKIREVTKNKQPMQKGCICNDCTLFKKTCAMKLQPDENGNCDFYDSRLKMEENLVD